MREAGARDVGDYITYLPKRKKEKAKGAYPL